MLKKVSIVMPTYKGERMLHNAIDSILKQTFSNIELIIVDDNGLGNEHQRNTESIINEFEDKRIRYITHKTNQNGAQARNTGLEAASGDYVCFHDDDDLMIPDRIEQCVETLEKNKGFDGILMDVLCCDEKMTPIRVVKIREEGNCTRELFVNGMFLGSGSNLFVTAKAANEIGGFDGDFSRHQDVEFMIRFYRKFKTKFISKIGIIKSTNRTVNTPEYTKFRKNEELFIKKFKKDIEKLDEEAQRKFYADVDYWLKISKATTGKGRGKMKGLSVKDKAMITALKLGATTNPISAFGIRQIRKRKVKDLKIDKRIMEFLKEYE